jgi:hypothetical protein
MWQKVLSLFRSTPTTDDTERSQVIATWMAPDDWECEHQFDTPESGPGIPSLRMLSTGAIIGRRIRSASTHIGDYGMGGPGFLGLELDAHESRPREWLVLCLWGAAEWCLFDGVPIESNPKSRMKEVGTKRFKESISGALLLEARIDDKSCELLIGRPAAGTTSKLEVPSDTRRLPAYGGYGGRRKLAATDSLLDAWALSPTEYLYV